MGLCLKRPKSKKPTEKSAGPGFGVLQESAEPLYPVSVFAKWVTMALQQRMPGRLTELKSAKVECGVCTTNPCSVTGTHSAPAGPECDPCEPGAPRQAPDIRPHTHQASTQKVAVRNSVARDRLLSFFGKSCKMSQNHFCP